MTLTREPDTYAARRGLYRLIFLLESPGTAPGGVEMRKEAPG